MMLMAGACIASFLLGVLVGGTTLTIRIDKEGSSHGRR